MFFVLDVGFMNMVVVVVFKFVGMYFVIVDLSAIMVCDHHA